MSKEKETLYGTKLTPEQAAEFDRLWETKGFKDRSAFIRAALTAYRDGEAMRATVAEAMVVILACQGRSVSTEQAIKLVKDLFLSGAFKEDLQ